MRFFLTGTVASHAYQDWSRSHSPFNYSDRSVSGNTHNRSLTKGKYILPNENYVQSLKGHDHNVSAYLRESVNSVGVVKSACTLNAAQPEYHTVEFKI